MEIQFHQQSIRDDALVESYLKQACKEGHKLSCQWNKKREKWDDATLETWLMDQCVSKQEPVAYVRFRDGSSLSCRSLREFPHKNASDWDGALTTFAIVCEEESRGCVELALA